MIPVRALMLPGAALLLAASAGWATTPSAPTSTAQGVYSAAQAQEGAAVYAARCAMCHGANLAGTWETPALSGKFMANWSGTRLSVFADYLARAMPQFAPGSLAPEDKISLVAYLLAANGNPAGLHPLPADQAALAAIAIAPAAPANQSPVHQ